MTTNDFRSIAPNKSIRPSAVAAKDRADDRRMASCSALFLFLAVMLLAAMLPATAFSDTTTVERSIESYTLPDVTLINQRGERVRLRSLLQTDKTVVIDFIFGTCTTICPVLSASFVNLQNKLGQDLNKLHLISITIDPENDTPEIMMDYLKRYKAKPGWDFFTGSRVDIDNIMRSLDAFMPNKMAHLPLNFIRRPSDGKWVRLKGLLSSKDFIREFKETR